MKTFVLFLSFGLLFNLAFAQITAYQKLTEDFDRIVEAQFKPGEPGATVLVSRKGQIIYKKAFGMANLELNVPMQPDNIFRIGSITKQFTAIAILQLMEQGKLNLQDEINKYIPDYPMQGKKITIENLLTHTSGIQSYTGMEDFMERMNLDLTPQEMIDHFKNEPMNFDPGTQWDYSNSGYFLLGYIIEKVTGITYPEYLDKHFFKPLGMSNSLYGDDRKIILNRAGAYDADDNGFINAPPMSMTQPYAAGSIQSTVEDLFKWHQAVHSYKLVSKATLDKAFTPYVLSDGKPTSYGYGWSMGYVQESPSIEHGGGIIGFLTMEIYLPEEDVFVAVFSNCNCHESEDVAAQLAASAIGKSYEQKEVDLNPATKAEYPAVYENADGEQRIITMDENQLYSQRGRNPKFKIRAFKKDGFFFDDALLTLEFTRNKKGEIESLISHNREGNVVWTRTDKTFSSERPEIKVDEAVLEKYVGKYDITPDFSLVVTREHDKLFVQATGQDKFEVFAEMENKFYLKLNDAQLEFFSDEKGNVEKVVLNQGGQTVDAKKVK